MVFIMKNVEVLYHIAKSGFVFSCKLQKELALSSNDVSARLHRFLKYGWVKRFKKLWIKGGSYGDVLKLYCVVRRGGEYIRIEMKEGKKYTGQLWLYLISEKGKEYLRFKGYSV